MRSRRAAIAATLAGALLIAGVPTLAFGAGDGTHEAKAYSATAASDDVAAQKAKDEDEKKKDADKKDAKKGGDEKKASEKKKDGDNKQAADKKDDKKAADKKKDDDGRKRHDNDAKKDDGRNRHDNDGKKDDGKKDADKKKKADDDKWASDRHDDWKNKRHGDKWDKDWDHDRDRHHRRHHWDTHRRYYRYGYYGPGYYDDCGYRGTQYYGYDDDDTGYRGYDGNYYQGSYYGPDACSYEYGGYRSHMLVDMSWDQVIPDRNAGGSPARDAYGTGNLDIDVAAGTICYRLAYDGIDRAIGAQIHPGRQGEVGPSLVLFHVGENGDDGCVGADPRLLSEIQNDPRGYYLEVNDEEHGQAMRGQLDAPDYNNRY
jgi:CHRD domain-containing protein